MAMPARVAASRINQSKNNPFATDQRGSLLNFFCLAINYMQLKTLFGFEVIAYSGCGAGFYFADSLCSQFFRGALFLSR